MTSDALSPSDGTQPPEASVEPFDAGPPPEPPLAGFDLPRLPELPSLPDLSSLAQSDAGLDIEADVTAHAAGETGNPDDEVPTPPQWPAISAADVWPAYAVPEAPPVTPAARFHLPAQPPTRPARPPVRDAEPSLLGLTRRSRTRIGQLAFKWVFVIIFGVILIQMIIALLTTH